MTTSGLLSVLDAIPTEYGAINARQGFAYQDDVAAGFFIEMLGNERLIVVACETHDDIVLIRKPDNVEIAEYVQVKAEHPDQLWSIAKLCEKAKTATKADGVGTSIVEKSLARDAHAEPSWFSIVTCRQIHPDLNVLTSERCHEYRLLSHAPFKSLLDAIDQRIGEVESKKGNGTAYWLSNTCWYVVDDGEIGNLNQHALTKALHAMDQPCDPDAVRSIYDELRTLAKDAAELGLDRRKEKCISRHQLIAKVKALTQPYPRMGQVERLERKLHDAGLDAVCLDVAKDQRRFYLTKKRSAAYLTTEEAEEIDHDVLDVLHKLRSALDSGEIADNGVKFHARCMNTVGEAARGKVPSSYLSGCMYEITTRCRHRFKKVTL